MRLKNRRSTRGIIMRLPQTWLIRKMARAIKSLIMYHDQRRKMRQPIKKGAGLKGAIEEPPKSQPLGYYLKHDINEKTINN